MAERLKESSPEMQDLESTTVKIFRTAAVVKGGRRFSFAALVVVGDHRGRVGLGYGKAPGVPAAIEKAQKEARKNLVSITLLGATIPHPVDSRFGAAHVRLVPAAPGTGVIAGGTVRAVLELAGVRDCLTKSYGSNNQKNLCKATIHGLALLQSKERVAELRGVEIEPTEVEERIAQGEKYAPIVRSERAKAPVSTAKDSRGQNRGRGRGKPRGSVEPRAARPAAPVPTDTQAPAGEASPPTQRDAPEQQTGTAPEAPTA